MSVLSHTTTMTTRIWNITDTSDCDLTEAASLLREQNQTICFPTETVYGLGANACNDIAVKRIFTAKQRPSDNPLIVHVSSLDAAHALVDITSSSSSSSSRLHTHFDILAGRFWPGPLTLIARVNTHANLSRLTTAGLNTVGVRIPNHPIALRLCSLSRVPIAAPSANCSGKPSPTCASHVLDDLNGRVGGIIDSGRSSKLGLESTVLDMSRYPYTILRPGAITLSDIAACIGDTHVQQHTQHKHDDDEEEERTPRAPGMKYRHYAPRAPLHYVNGSAKMLLARVRERVDAGERVGVLAPEQAIEDNTLRSINKNVVIKLCGHVNDDKSVARQFYASLRAFDAIHEDPVDVIFGFGFERREGLAEAIWNRMMKACSSVIHED